MNRARDAISIILRHVVSAHGRDHDTELTRLIEEQTGRPGFTCPDTQNRYRDETHGVACEDLSSNVHMMSLPEELEQVAA